MKKVPNANHMSLARSFRCALTEDGKCFVGCRYHNWVKTIAGDVTCALPGSSISVTLSLVMLSNITTPRVLMPTGAYLGRKRVRVQRFTDGVQRLVEFLRLARLFDSAPWANKWFNVNHDIFVRLTASHLHLIVGKQSATEERAQLLKLLSAYTRLDGCSNLVWITNRQQGKTTTVGKFIALLSITSRVGGLLAAIYSTSLDRAVELVKAAKKYLYWYQGFSGGKIKFVRDCERTFVLSNGFAENEIGARPKVSRSSQCDAVCLLVSTYTFY